MAARSTVLCAALLVCSLHTSCGSSALARYEFSAPKMGTEFRIVLYAEDNERAEYAARRAFERIDELEACMSDYRQESELVQLSRHAGSEEQVPVSEDLWRVLLAAEAVSLDSGGAFDVTVGPLVRLWRRARRQEQAPDDEDVEAARRSVGFAYLHLDPRARSVRLEAPGMRLDLGGIAKGDALDEALEVLKQEGIDAALIDGGGDVRVGAAPPGRSAWRVEVQAPGEPLRLELEDAAVATSGDAYQFVELEGVRYSHILDPRTGRALSSAATVSVIARDGRTADALASAASVLGPQEGLVWLSEKSGVDARWVWVENESLRACETPGFERKMAPAPAPSEISTRPPESP